ncbi:MAG TPA: hypothetical protein VHW00_15145 [Thermoanaerobaculia bacterium]|nr:hypothetical protein [Thermoanaerobaculia bacterium]
MSVPTGQVVWYVSGRFYVPNGSTAIYDAGFFLHLPILGADLTNQFTFLAQPFTSKDFYNGDLKIGIDPVGEFSVFYQETPTATYDDPQSFGHGLRIATFRRVSIVAGVEIASVAQTNVFSSVLTSSTPFTYNDVLYDFAELLPHGVTQWGTASTNIITPPPDGYATVIPFVGSAIAVGR